RKRSALAVRKRLCAGCPPARLAARISLAADRQLGGAAWRRAPDRALADAAAGALFLDPLSAPPLNGGTLRQRPQCLDSASRAFRTSARPPIWSVESARIAGPVAAG